jgi:hypothetical protein
MVTIQIDEQTADGLAKQAQGMGLSVADYLRTLVPANGSTQLESWEDLERELLELSTAGPSLPDDFSRADIYNENAR